MESGSGTAPFEDSQFLRLGGAHTLGWFVHPSNEELTSILVSRFADNFRR
jgi:hypothetical protein